MNIERRGLVAAILCTLTATWLSAQPLNGLVFEAASVKPNTSGPQALQRMTNLPPGERVTFINVTVRNLIQVAYPGFSEISGGPDWMGAAGPPSASAARFDLNAKADALATHEELQTMLRALLARRFKLIVHTDSKEEPTYALVLARSDGKLGPHLHQASSDCATLRAQPNLPRGEDPCGLGPAGNALITGKLSLHGVTFDQLSSLLARDAQRPIVDKTGLSGTFDWDLIWTPQRFSQAPFDRERFPSIDPDGPTLFTALQEQLGLKLVSETTKQPVLVIDHVEHPSED